MLSVTGNEQIVTLYYHSYILHVHRSLPVAPVIRAACARFVLSTLLTFTIHVRPVGGSTYLPCVKHSSHSNVVINSPALVGHNQLSRATPTLFIGRQHATSARRGAPRRVPLFKPKLRLETPEKESRTRLLHSHRAVCPRLPPFKLLTVAVSGKWTSEVWKNGAKVRGGWLPLSRSSRALERST